MKRITPAIREEAALICAISASWPADRRDHHYLSIGRLIGASDEARSVAADALLAVPDDGSPSGHRLWRREDDAEAEALLRTGYVPEGWTT